MRQFVMRGDDATVSQCVILRAPGPAKYLHDVKHAEINERTLLCIVDLCSLKQSQTITLSSRWLSA